MNNVSGALADFTRKDHFYATSTKIERGRKPEREANADVITAKDANSAHLRRWRLVLVTLGYLLCLFLANLEITIVSTALVSMTNDLRSFSQASWIVTGYLLTFTAFLIIWAKASDIFGRKSCLLSTLILFIAFSTACGGARTMNQIITFRVLQGIGAAGLYSLSILLCYEIVPKAKYPLYGSLISAVVACATLMGPLFGGLINDKGSWRWVFYLNLPVGALALCLLAAGLPNGYPHHGQSLQISPSIRFSRKTLVRLDFVGAGLLLTASFLLVTALLEASSRFSWSSGITISLLTISSLAWCAFFTWEWLVTGESWKPEPVFPWRFLSNKPWMLMLITTFLVGAPFNAAVVALPERLQAVSGTSALGAGIRLMPYSLTASLGSFAASVAGKLRVPIVYIMATGACLQVLGLTLLSTLPTSSAYPASGFAYEVLAGAGVGVTFGILMLATPYVADARDLAVATGAIIQFRFLGGAIGLAITSAVLNQYMETKLDSIVSADQLKALQQNSAVLTTLDAEVQRHVREVFADGYNMQFRILVGFAVAQVPVAALFRRRKDQLRTV